MCTAIKSTRHPKSLHSHFSAVHINTFLATLLGILIPAEQIDGHQPRYAVIWDNVTFHRLYQLNRPHRRLLCLRAYTPFINPTELFCPACCLRIYKAPRSHTPPIDNRGSMRWYNYWSISGVDLSCQAILPLLLDQWEHCLWCHLDLVAQKQGAAFFPWKDLQKGFFKD